MWHQGARQQPAGGQCLQRGQHNGSSLLASGLVWLHIVTMKGNKWCSRVMNWETLPIVCVHWWIPITVSMLAEWVGPSVGFRCVSNYAHPTPHKYLGWGTDSGHLECACRDLSQNRFYGPLPIAPQLFGSPPSFLYDLSYNYFFGSPDIYFVTNNSRLALCKLLTASRARQAVATIDAPLEGLGLTNTIASNCLRFPPALSACAKKFPQRSNGACARFGRRK